jgi:hypothetical protein
MVSSAKGGDDRYMIEMSQNTIVEPMKDKFLNPLSSLNIV